MCVNMCYVCVLYMRAVRRKGIQKHIFIMFINQGKKISIRNQKIFTIINKSTYEPISETVFAY